MNSAMLSKLQLNVEQLDANAELLSFGQTATSTLSCSTLALNCATCSCSTLTPLNGSTLVGIIWFGILRVPAKAYDRAGACSQAAAGQVF
jgi:hypothetical protein